MERKFLITSVFVTLGAIAFLSGYLLMPEQDLNRQAGTFLNRFNNDAEINLSDNKTPDIAPLSSRKFLSFVNPFTDSQKIVAADNGGNIIELDLATLDEELYYTGQTSIVATLLSPAGDSVIYSFYDAENNKKYTYLNFKRGESSPIAGDVRSAAFSPRGDQSAHLISRRSASGTDDGGELLISKGINIIKRALKARLGAAIVNWPADFISIISYDKDEYGDLFVLKEDGALNKVLSYQYGLEIKWSSSGEKIIFSAKDNTNSNRLFYKDIKNSGAVTDLDINVNASKCAWVSEEEVICGIKNQAQPKDEFYKIGLGDKSKTLVATPDINLLTKELAVSRSGDIIFVLNDIDSKLYALKLKSERTRP